MFSTERMGVFFGAGAGAGTDTGTGGKERAANEAPVSWGGGVIQVLGVLQPQPLALSRLPP